MAKISAAREMNSLLIWLIYSQVSACLWLFYHDLQAEHRYEMLSVVVVAVLVKGMTKG